MELLSTASEDEMVCAFLVAELDSPHWSAFIRRLLRADLGIVTHPSVDDPTESLIRRLVLAAYRGYGIENYLFVGFPDDATWSRATVTTAELGSFRYANCEPWAPLAGGARLVRHGAERLEVVPNDRLTAVQAIEDRLHQGDNYPPLIAAGIDSDGEHVLIEGHTRATAHVRASAPSRDIDLIVGHSSAMAAWRYW